MVQPGGDSKASYVAFSSYDVLDAIFEHFSAHRRDLFPALTGVVFSGFSAGGQMINRYSWVRKCPACHAMPVGMQCVSSGGVA